MTLKNINLKTILSLIILHFCVAIIGINKVYAEEIPKVYFEGDITNMTEKTDVRDIAIRYQSKNLTFEKYAKIKVQGTSSLMWDKKNYTINIYEDNSYNKKANVDVGQGWGAQSVYCLKANWVDKTHARNIVTARIAADVQKKYDLFVDTPNYGLIDGFPVEVYINGDFLGLYTWNIPKGDWMFGATEEDEDFLVFSGADWKASVAFKEEEVLNGYWDVEAGQKSQASIDKLNELIRFVKDSSDEEFKRDFSKHLDLDSVLNYYVLGEFAFLSDNYGKNMLLVTYDGKKWYTSLYDLDTSWGTEWHGYNLKDYTTLAGYSWSNLFNRLDKNYTNEISNRYFQLRKELLSKEYVMNQFEEFNESIPAESFEKERTRWEGYFIPGFEISQIETYLNEKIPLLDKHFYEKYMIDPEVSIEYIENRDGTVTASFICNREDIMVLKDGTTSLDNTYTFKENGSYTFEYQDWYGNKGSVEAKVDWIKSKDNTENTNDTPVEEKPKESPSETPSTENKPNEEQKEEVKNPNTKGGALFLMLVIVGWAIVLIVKKPNGIKKYS